MTEIRICCYCAMCLDLANEYMSVTVVACFTEIINIMISECDSSAGINCANRPYCDQQYLPHKET